MTLLTDTGHHNTPFRDVDPAHRETFAIVERCGGHLDAPDYLLCGGLFWAPLCREALPVAIPRGF